MSILGIDIGATQLKCGRVDEAGRLLSSRAVKTPASLEAFETALHYMVASGDPPEGIGIGCKGLVNPETTRIEVLPGTLHFLEGRSLAEMIRPAIRGDVPIRADNDARVALVGEIVWGTARGRSDVLMLTLGSGVGGAVLTGGRILRGHTGVGGHLGHLTVVPDGRECICGNRGCLETVFAAHAIEGEAFSAVHRGVASLLTERFAARPDEISCRAVFDAAAEGDCVARGILDRGLRALGGAIAGLLHVFDPELVIIGGHIAEAGAALLDPLRSEIAWRTGVMLCREVPLVTPGVQDPSGIVGAAALVASSSGY
jgi:glucokinase